MNTALQEKIQYKKESDEAENSLVENSLVKKGWMGKIEITLSCLATELSHAVKADALEKTVISSVKHIGPLRVQRAFYPEGNVCHVYLLHPPGGVVGGDSLDIDISAENNSRALFTTPGSTKFYRSAGECAHLRQILKVENGSSLEWFPQENMFFPGAKVKIKTTIVLEGNANFIGWEINCFGRPVNNEKFDSGMLDAVLTIIRDDETLLIERQRVFEIRHLNAATGLRGYPMNAIFVCTSCTEAHLELARETVANLCIDFPVGITLIDDVLVLRALGESTEKLQTIMIAVWKKLRLKTLNKVAVSPRIWAT